MERFPLQLGVVLVILKFLKELLDSIPSKLSTVRHNLPWMTAEIKRLCSKKRRVYQKAKKGSAGHQALFTKLQNATRDALRKAHWSYVNGILQASQETGDNKNFWRYVKAQERDTTGESPQVRRQSTLRFRRESQGPKRTV